MEYCVLAGGQSRRMGKDKALLKFGNVCVAELLAKRFRQGTKPVHLSSADGSIGAHFVHMKECLDEITDCIAGIGPAGGIYSLLKALETDIFVVATDMPFADVKLAQCLMRLGGVCESDTAFSAGVKDHGTGGTGGGSDARKARPDMAVLLRADGHMETLFAYYGQGCLAALEAMIAEENYRLKDLALRVKCSVVTEAQVVAEYGAGCHRALMNMNTPEDYALALEMAGLSCDCPII